MNKLELCEKLKNEGFSDFIVKAFRNVERKSFVPLEYHKKMAYDDIPLPIGYEQTISQPSTIAFMLSLLEFGGEGFQLSVNRKIRILEVGSGSGYVLALMERIAKEAEIFGVERIKALYERSVESLKGVGNIRVFYTPKSLGLPDFAPFDRIIVSASADDIPNQLVAQLVDGGIMVCPVRDSIFKITKNNNIINKQEFSGFRFVPLVE